VTGEKKPDQKTHRVDDEYPAVPAELIFLWMLPSAEALGYPLSSRLAGLDCRRWRISATPFQ
jgi:hypothetical protein